MGKARSPLIRLISFMANFTPNTIYFPKGWPKAINDLSDRVEKEKGCDKSPLVTSAISVACASSAYMKEGDEVTFNMTSVSYKGKEVGDYEVIIRRMK